LKIEKAKGLAIFFYKESEEKTKNFLKKFESIGSKIKLLIGEPNILFETINMEKEKELAELYEVNSFPCIFMYYLSDQIASFIPKHETK
jgi:hypothetical protein